MQSVDDLLGNENLTEEQRQSLKEMSEMLDMLQLNKGTPFYTGSKVIQADGGPLYKMMTFCWPPNYPEEKKSMLPWDRAVCGSVTAPLTPPTDASDLLNLLSFELLLKTTKPKPFPAHFLNKIEEPSSRIVEIKASAWTHGCYQKALFGKGKGWLDVDESITETIVFKDEMLRLKQVCFILNFTRSFFHQLIPFSCRS